MSFHEIISYFWFQAKVSGSKSEGNFEEALMDEKEMGTNGATTPTAPEDTGIPEKQ